MRTDMTVPPDRAARRHPRQPIFNAPPATLALCFVLIACHVLMVMVPAARRAEMYDSLSFQPARFWAQFAADGGLTLAGVLPLISHAFLHADFFHLIVNTGLLLAFAAVVERRLGAIGMMSIFLVGVGAGAVAQLAAEGAIAAIMIGASGGVHAVMGAAAVMFYCLPGTGQRRAALIFVAVIVGLNLALGVFSLGPLIAGSKVAWQAHIGGLIAGAILGYVWLRLRFSALG